VLSPGEKFTASGGTNGTVMGSWVNDKWVGILNRQMRVIGQEYQLHCHNTNLIFTVIIRRHGVKVNNIEETADCN
jgi:hypothetical protein